MGKLSSFFNFRVYTFPRKYTVFIYLYYYILPCVGNKYPLSLGIPASFLMSLSIKYSIGFQQSMEINKGTKRNPRYNEEIMFIYFGYHVIMAVSMGDTHMIHAGS